MADDDGGGPARAPPPHVQALRRAGRAAPRPAPSGPSVLRPPVDIHFLPPFVHSFLAMVSPRAPTGHAVQASKARIVEDAIAYVGVLRATVAGLEARAASARSARTAGPAGAAAAGAAEVLLAGKASCFAVRLPMARRRGALTRVLEVFRRHGVPVLAATVTSDGGEAAVTVTTAPVPPRFLERIQQDIRSSIA